MDGNAPDAATQARLPWTPRAFAVHPGNTESNWVRSDNRSPLLQESEAREKAPSGRRGLKTEARIGPKAYLSPGGPFAGGTLARDIEYLGAIGKINHVPTPLISSVRLSNDEHKKWVRRKLVQKFQSMKGIKVALWGLTYKAGTDTLRRSLSVELCNWLIEQNAMIKVYDPVAKELPNHWSSVVMSSNASDTLKDAQVLIIGTEWPEFKENVDQILLAAKPNLVIIDANRYLGKSKAPLQFNYISVGIPES
jgi:UDPglucose 6-dehydrogenase